jgi:TonB-linked SusC/RagA family outer membrane protein
MWSKHHKNKAIFLGMLSFGLILVFSTCSLAWSQSTEAEEESSESLISYVGQQKSTTSITDKVISVNLENVRLIEAATKVAEQSGLKLSYSKEAIPVDKRVSLNMRNAKFNEVMYKLLEGTGLRYGVSANNNLVIFKSTQPQQDGVQQQLEIVSGRVTDAETGESLPGVNIIVKGTTRGVSTESDGRYELDVASLQDTLVFSFIGYETREVPINGRTTINIELQSQALAGEEVVVIGYGSQQAREVTSSIVTVNSENLNPVATSSINQMLRGKAAGLNLQQRTAQPGGGVSVNIRGDISPLGSGTPLYVIDGVPITNYSSSVPRLADSDLGYNGGIDRDPLSYLNPSDIESITVLKDASATAIYGSAAANGVVLITTKSGRSGSLQVDYRGNYTAQTPHEYFPLLNEKEFMQHQDRLARDAWRFDNRIAPYGSTDPSSVAPYTPLFSESQINSAGEGTDWLGLVTEKGYINEHNLALSGGSENTIIYASFNYQGNDGVLKNSRLNRYAGRVNIDQYIGDNVHLKVKSTASRQTGSNASSGSNSGGGEKFNMLQAAYAYSPTVDIYNSDGTFASTFDPLIMNPAAFLTIDDQSKTDHLFTAPNLTIDFSENLTANFLGQVDVETTNRSFYLPRITNNAQLPDGMAQKSESRIENYTAESYITYSDDFENSSLTVVAGAGYYKTMNEFFGLQAVGFFTDAFSYNNVSIASNVDQNSLWSGKNERVKLSQFARVNFSLYDRYIFTASIRRDGSSVFSENNKYGYFPGGSVAWRISEENFIRDIPEISDLKLRVGYSLAGNESVLRGNSLQLYSSGFTALIGDTEYNGVALAQVANPDLTWEKNYTFNLGLDFGFLSNRIRGSADYFVKTAKDLLDYNPLPSNNAVGRVADNVGTTQSKGFEVTLHTQNIAGNIFNWTSDLNISRYEAKWQKRNPKIPLADYIHEKGMMDAIYGWETDGIIRSADEIPSYQSNAFVGNVKYVDQNGDGELDGEDVVVLGNGNPRWTAGLNNTFSYRNFDLSVYLYGSFDYLRGNNYAPGVFGISQATNPTNTTIYAKDIFSADNTDGKYPGVADNPYASNNPTGTTDFNLYDASFIRIRDISLSYNIPASIFGAGNPVRRARIFVNLEDLGVISNYPGFDPEYTEPNPYPKSYSTTVGIELNF